MPEEKENQQADQSNEQALVPQRTTPMREMLAVLKDTGDADLFKAFARDIIEREVAAARFGQDSQLARVFAGSGVFDGINGTVQGVSLAMTKIQLGRSWNMQPADAMEAINFINGRPSVAARHLAARMQDAGLSWDIEWDEDASGNCTGCHLHLKRWNPEANRYEPIMGRVNGKEQQAVVSFTKKDADNAMIHENGKQIRLSEKWNFKSWPSDMYFARCVSRVRVRYAANILSGILTREEAEDSGDGIPPAGVSRGAERAAIASAAKTEEIAKKLAPPPVVAPAAASAAKVADIGAQLQQKASEAQAASSTNPNPTATTGAPSATVGAIPSNVVPISPDKAPWAGHEKPRVKMAEMFSAMLRTLGDDYKRLLTEYGLNTGARIEMDKPETLACYRAMEKLVDERAKQQQGAAAAGQAPQAEDAPLF